MLALALALLLVVPDAPPPRPVPARRPAPAKPGLSWAEADSLSRKLATIEERHRLASKGKRSPVPVTQSEVNSYLNLSYASELPKGVSDVEVRFGRERIEAKGYVDIEQVRGKVAAPSSWNPLSLLSGLVPVELGGKLLSKDGFGTIELDTAYVANIRVPVSVVEQMVSSSTKSEKHPDGFDINAPFRLPYSVSRVRLDPGKATLEF